MNYIGVDCHISSLDFAVANEKGTVTQRAKVNTGEPLAEIKNNLYFLESTRANN